MASRSPHFSIGQRVFGALNEWRFLRGTLSERVCVRDYVFGDGKSQTFSANKASAHDRHFTTATFHGVAGSSVSTRDKPLSVAELVRLTGRCLDGMGLLWIEGEVAQVSQPASGHLYFALRDRDAVLPAVMWSRDVARQKFRIEPGQRLRVRGRIGVYERDGKMQLYVDFAEPAGLGAEAMALEQLKRKLAAEGIFAADRKRPLPRFPRRIGVVTSRTGAAIHDIIRTVHRRLPTPILIADAAVQGPGAPNQLVQGMAMVVRAGVDVVIVGRGGGAVTDLKPISQINIQF